MLKKLLQRTDVHTQNHERILQTIKSMQQQGREKLIVLTDFDMTLTRYHVNGKRGKSSYGIIESASVMPEEYRKEVAVLKDKYGSLETDISLTKEERSRYMKEWYTLAHRLMMQYGVKKDDLKEMVAGANIILRDGCDYLFTLLNSNDVPLIIVSAGISDILLVTMELQSKVHKNVTVFSNCLKFDEKGVATGFYEPTIDSANKGNLHDHFAGLSAEIKERTNVILIGDSLEDPQMANGMEKQPQHMIKIGFLNHDVEHLLPTYLDLYDVVLTGDGDMEVINQILEQIILLTEESVAP